MMALNQNLAHKELIAFTILNYKFCVNQSRDMSREHFTNNRKLLTNCWPVEEKKTSNNIFLILIKYF